MSSQPTSGAQGTLIQAAGTTILSDKMSTLKKIVFAGTFVGSVEFYDANTAAGTAAGNLMYNVGLPLLNQYKDIDLDTRFRTGIVCVATGTPVLLVTKD
jgi:hypothetical protein